MIIRDKCLVNKNLCRPWSLILEKQRRMRTQGQCEGFWRLRIQGAVQPPWGLGAGRGGFEGGEGFPEGLGIGTGDEGIVVALEGYGEVQTEEAQGEAVAGTAGGGTAQNASAWARVTRVR